MGREKKREKEKKEGQNNGPLLQQNKKELQYISSDIQENDWYSLVKP